MLQSVNSLYLVGFCVLVTDQTNKVTYNFEIKIKIYIVFTLFRMYLGPDL